MLIYSLTKPLCSDLNGLWIWAADSKTVKGWTHVVDLTLLSYSWSSSIHSLTPKAWLVCCRGLRLLPSTMSEHMQLSLALCRIGLYTVRKCIQATAICFVREWQGCAVLSVCWIRILLVSPWFNLSWLCFETDTDQATAAAASLLLGHWMESTLRFIRVGVHIILRWNRWTSVLWDVN